MAFTFAHPAAVLPLRRYADPTALVIGSMIPDAGYFLGFTLPRYFTHSPIGIAFFCLPAGLITYALFRCLLRDALVSLTPLGLQRRLPASPSMPSSLDTWAKVAMAILVGALTHVVWDEFTNWSWHLIHHFPWFSEKRPGLFGGWVRKYDYLDQATSVLGLAVVAAWVGLWWWRAPPRQDVGALPLPLRLFLLCLIGGMTAGVSLLLLTYTDLAALKKQSLAGLAAATLPAASLSIFAYALFWRLAFTRPRPLSISESPPAP